MTAKVPWRNRIIGYGEEAPDQLLANPKNWRIHPKAQHDALAEVLDEVGWIQDVIVNQNTGYVVDGHLRVALAISRQELMVPVKYVDLTPEEEALVLASIDPLAAMAVADKDLLADLLREVNPTGANVWKMLDDLAEGAGIGEQGKEIDDPGPDFDHAEELRAKWGVEREQLWVVGEHRVLCADSTLPANVARLMAGQRAAMVFTDPPYGISYDTTATGRSNRQWEAIECDDLRAEALEGFNRKFLTVAMEHLREDGVLYVCGADKTAHRLIAAAEGMGIHYAVPIVWVKQHFALNWDRYHPQHEFVFYGGPGSVPTGPRSRWFGPQNETTVWQIDREPVADYNHPTQKPVALAERAIRNSAAGGEIVLDLFLGSGTTLVAAEKTGRRCYGMEVEPKYVAVVLERAAGIGLEPCLED